MCISQEGQKYGYDTEAFAIYDTMKYVNPPVHTVAVGTAWGEAAMLLASGEKARSEHRTFLNHDIPQLHLTRVIGLHFLLPA